MLSIAEFDKKRANRNTSLFGDSIDAFQAGAAESVSGMANFVGWDSAAKKLQELADAQYSTMTPESQNALAKRMINDDLSMGEGMTDARTWLLQGMKLAGNMATTALPGGAAGKAVSLAGNVAKGANAVGTVGKLATATNIGSNMALNIASAGGMLGQQAQQAVEELDFADLKDSPAFQNLVKQYHSEGYGSDFEILDKARQTLAEQANETITKDPTMMVINGVFGTLGDQALGKVMGGGLGKTLKSQIAKSFATEGTTEAVQGGAEQYTQNVGINEQAETQLFEPTQGVAANAIESGVIGAVAGGAIGAPGHGVHKVRQRRFAKELENKIPQEVIEQMRASGYQDADIKNILWEKTTNAAIARGFEPDEADLMAKNYLSTVFDGGPTAEQRAEAEDVEQAQQNQESQPEQPQPEQQAEQPQQQGPTGRFQSTAPGALHNDANNLIKELQTKRKQAIKDGNQDLANQIGQDMSRLMGGRDRVIKDIKDNEGNVTEPKFDEQGRGAYMNALRRTAENYGLIVEPAQPEVQEQAPQQEQMFNPETGEVINPEQQATEQNQEPVQQNPETVQQDQTALAESMRRGDLGFVDEAAQQDSQFRAGLRRAMEISPAAVLQVAQLRKSGQMNQNQAISALQRIINSVEVTGIDQRQINGEELTMRNQAARERNAQRVQYERGEGGSYQPNVEESPEFQRRQAELLQGRQEQAHTTGQQDHSRPNGERDVSPYATGIENQFEANAPQVEFDRWSQVQEGDQNTDQREYNSPYAENPQTTPIEQDTVYQPRQQEREQARYEEPEPTAQEYVNQSRGKRGGVLTGDLMGDKSPKRNKRQAKKAANKLNKQLLSIYGRISQSDPLDTNEVEEYSTGYQPNAAMLEAFEGLHVTQEQPTAQEVENRVDQMEQDGAITNQEADQVRDQNRRDFIANTDLPENAPVWMQQDQDNVDTLSQENVDSLYQAIQDLPTTEQETHQPEQSSQATTEQREKLIEIANDFFRGLDNVNKTVARKAREGAEIHADEAAKAIAQHDEYIEGREARAKEADQQELDQSERVYGSLSKNELLRKLSNLGSTGYVSGEISDGRRSTSKAVTNEAARGKAEESMKLERYIKHKYGDLNHESTKSNINQVDHKGVSLDLPVVPKETEADYNRGSHLGRGRDFNQEILDESKNILDTLDSKGLLDTPERKAKAKELIEKYQDSNLDFIKWEAAHAVKHPSWHVTGRSNRNMSKYNEAQDRHMRQFSSKVDALTNQKKRIASSVESVMNADQKAAKEEQGKENVKKRMENEVIGYLVRDIFNYMLDGKPETAKDNRKWALRKAKKSLETLVFNDKSRALKLVNDIDSKAKKESKGKWGVMAIVGGKRSALGKYIDEMLSSKVNETASEAAKETNTNPTEAQKEAGNYKKGSFDFHGLTVAIENPKGSERSGTDSDGESWSVTMKNHYGYIKRTEGADGDAVDVFVGPDEASKVAYVIDQIDPNTGSFDEHKVMLGFTKKTDAKKAYLENYAKGWKGFGEMSVVKLDDFKKWLKEGDLEKPYSTNFTEPTPPEGPKGTKKGGYTRTQTAPRGNEAAKPKTLKEFTKAILDVDSRPTTKEATLSVAKSFRDNHDAMITELNSMTMPNIKKMMGNYWSMMNKDLKKDRLVKTAYDDLMKNFLFSITDGAFITTSGQSGLELGDYVIKQIEAVSSEKFNEIQAKKAEQRKAEEAETNRKIEALSDPKTLQDFVAYARNKGNGIESFTPEQLRRYDELVSENKLQQLEQQRKAAAEVKAVDGDVPYQLAETIHTKLQEPRYVVQLTGERMGKDAFKELAARARQLGGNYVNAMQAKRYNTIDGFQFANVDDRNNFAKLLDGESVSREANQQRRLEAKQDNRVSKLKEMADTSEAKADAVLNQDRKTNTARRASEAARVMDNAYADQYNARLLRAIAEATENGDIQVLSNLSQKVQLDELDTIERQIVWNMPEEQREKFAERTERGNWRLKADTKLDDILYWAKYPVPESRPDRLNRLADDMENVSGYKQAAKKIRSKTKNANERDLIQMTGRDWESAVAKIREFARKNKNEYVAENIAEMFKREDRLNRMGIDGPAMLRYALREKAIVEQRISTDRPIETPVSKLTKKVEETIRANPNAYNDFFPTDNDTLADQVIDEADIQPGMKVLEPSAGMGHLADKIKAKGADLDVGEYANTMSELLSEKGHNVVSSDFLEYNPGPIYDRIVMNPPFSHDGDVKHVTHAISMLKPGGRLVAITSSMAGNRSNSANKNFREYLDSVGAVEEAHPANSFKNSLNPTSVNTKTIIIDKPMDAADLPVPEDIRFSQNAVTEKPAKGMKAEIVEKAAQTWLDGYAGLKAANVQVVQSQSDLQNWVQTDPDATVKAVWMSQDNRVILVADNLVSPQDVRKAMRHELIGHNGVFGNLNPEQSEKLTAQVMNLRKNKKLSSVFSEVDASYKNAPDYVKAEEVVSRLAEQESGKLRQIADRVMAFVMGAMRRSGFLAKDKATLSEIRNMINGADKYLRTKDGKLSLPDAIRFSQHVDKVQSIDQEYMAVLEGTQQSLLQKILRAPKEFISKSKLRDAAKGGAYGLFTLRQLVDIADKKVNNPFANHLQSYLDEVNQMVADEGRMTQDVLDIYEPLDKWRRKNPELADRTFDMMHDFTLDNVDPFQEYQDLTDDLKKSKRVIEEQIRGMPGTSNAKRMEELKDIDRQIKYEPKRKKNLEAAKQQLKTLPKDAQDVIKTIRDHYVSQRENTTNALMDKAATLAMDGGKLGKAMALKIRLDNEIAKKGFYVPLARFGDYSVDGIDENGERVFTMYNTQAEAEEAYNKLKEAGFQVNKPRKSVDDFAGLDSVSSAFVTKMVQQIETTTMSEKARAELADRVYQLFLEGLPQRSIRKQFMHRKGVKGFSQDALQALADQGAKQAKQLSRTMHEDQLSGYLEGLDKEYNAIINDQDNDADRIAAARIMDEMGKRQEWVMNPKRAEWASKVTGLGFFWLIGASPASALINITQNVQVALPVIGSKYGTAPTARVMAGLTGDFFKNFRAAHADMSTRRKNGILGSTILKGDELKAMQEAIAMGTIDTTQTHDLIGMAEAKPSDLTGKYQKVMQAVGWMFHHAEVLNREVTFMTAYRMAKQNGEGHKGAFDYAIKATWDSHFDYGSLNRARFMQGDVAAVALQFKQYSQNMTFYLMHNFLQAFAIKNPVTGTFYSTVSKNTSPEERSTARKQLLGTMAATFLFGGLGAMPVATVAAIANLANDMVGDDDEPWDAEVEMQQILKEWFGKELGDGIWYGLGTMAGAPNISSRIEIDPLSMWIRPSERLDASSKYMDYTESLLGPTWSIGKGFARGFDYIFRDQKYQKGFESFAPKWVRDVSKTARYLGEGGTISNNNGDVIVSDLSGLEHLEQALGFTPSRAMIQNNENRAIKGYERKAMDRRKLLLNSMWLAYRNKDQAATRNLWKKINKYNQSEWGRARPITKDVIRQSLKSRIRSQSMARKGLHFNAKYQGLIDSNFVQD